MPKRLCLVGQRFGYLTVVEDAGNHKQGHSQWLCQCDCGNGVVVVGSSLKNGHTKSCGCLYRPNLIGRKFGRLLVIDNAGHNRWKAAQWLCKCDCGTEKTVLGSNLVNGVTKSCGCLRREKMIEAGKSGKGEKNNNYKHGQTGTKAFICRISAERRAKKKKQTPIDVDIKKIQLIYSFCEMLNQASEENYEVDHIIPLSKGGLHHQDNL